MYRAWGHRLPPNINVCPVQPPGRERRQGELPFTSVEPMVEVLAQEIITSVRFTIWPTCPWKSSPGYCGTWEERPKKYWRTTACWRECRGY